MRWPSTIFLIAVLVVITSRASAKETKVQLLEVQKIWDAGNHNAFTDLVRFKGEWFCVFREGKAHVSPDGALRVIRSKDGKMWTSAALIKSDVADLRDAKISVTPDGKLMLTGAGAMHKGPIKHQSKAWFRDDGENWSEAVDIGDVDHWLWRVTWRGNQAIGIGYATGGQRRVRLYTSNDGRKYETIVEDLKIEGYPNETSILFRDDGTALCLLRRDPQHGLLGSAKPPYKEWTWKDVGTRIGGPHMIALPGDAGGRLIAVVRLYDKPVRTSVCEIDADTGKLTELLKLPSGGDTSYAGLVWHESELWISYYSSHEKKTSIYLARVKVE